MAQQKTILYQVESFGVFAVLMLALASFQPTHKIAVGILALVAIGVLVKNFAAIDAAVHGGAN